ncbi:MAG TPA: hypothetical protein VKS79_16460 [Gemmataceae bacterium]|nr:hypothetical protein [Gemmataceae bacterium]
MQLEEPIQPVKPFDAVFIGKPEFSEYEDYPFLAELHANPLELAFGGRIVKMGNHINEPEA